MIPEGDLLDGEYGQLHESLKYMANLWRAIVAQGLRDLVHFDERVEPGSADPERVEVTTDAIIWLDSDDFQEACDLAYINAKRLMAEVREIIPLAYPYRRLKMTGLAWRLNDRRNIDIEEEEGDIP